MTEVYIEITGAVASASKNGPLVAGMVGVPANFSFDDSWGGLNITVVFSGSGKKIDWPLLDERTLAIPWEVMTKPNTQLQIGAEGRLPDGTLVIPTVWATVGTLKAGAQSTGNLAQPPSPTPYDRIMSAIGDLNQLNTEAKDSLVAAINEAAQSGGGEVDAEEIQRIVAEYLAANPLQENDPNVSEWAKQPEKPTYTAEEVGALPADTQIPTELPNPAALTFTGAVSATYDGSKAVEVEIPSGGGDAVYSETILTEAVSSVEFSLDGATEFSIAFNVPVVEAAMTYCFALINGKQTGFVSANIGATDKERFTFFTVKRVGERLWFMRIKTGNTDTYANSMFNTTEDIPINGGSISIGIETFGIKCYGKQQFPVGTTIYTIGGGGSL